MADTSQMEAQFLQALKSALKRTDLGKKELARLSGLSRQYIYDLEQGATGISLDAAARLSRALGTTVGALLGEDGAPAPTVADPRIPEARDLVEKLRDLLGDQVRENVLPFRNGNVDEPQELHESELEVVAYAAAGQDRHPEPNPTGETVLVINPIYRTAKRRNWKAVKIVGNSMEPDYVDGDFVIIEPAREARLKPGDVAYVMFNGDPLLKILDFRRDKETGEILGLVLRSLNPTEKPIAVGEHDWFHAIGVEAYKVTGRRNYR